LSYQLRVSPRAAAQIRTAEEWWLKNRTKAPEAFTEELEKALALIQALPSAGEPVPHSRHTGVRRILLSRVRYYPYYRPLLEEEIVEILSIWHTSRGSRPIL